MTDIDGNVLEASVPYTRVRLADYAQLVEDLATADSALYALQQRADRYVQALREISAKCMPHDDARAYIGDIARTAINPIAAKPGQEKSL